MSRCPAPKWIASFRNGTRSVREDIPSLVKHFAARLIRPLRFSQDAIDLLSNAEWPGNIRQLRNMLERLAILSDDDPITESTLKHLALVDFNSDGEQNELEKSGTDLKSFLTPSMSK